jgi:hypothetical protein
MPLSLKQSKALRDLAQAFSGFLPGSGNASWLGHVTFKSVAERVGVPEFWPGGSKLPAVTSLLENTFEQRRPKFEVLVVEIFRAGLTYRQKNSNPVTAGELDQINQSILELGFKFPDLWDPKFRSSLKGGTEPAARQAKEDSGADRRREKGQADRRAELESLRKDFLELGKKEDRQAAGLAFEKVLNRLFRLHGLAPRGPFKVVGEQIDGSFELDHEIYLLEARWRKDASSPADLYVFREKIEGKSKFTRGVFLSISGVSPDAPDAITRGKQPNFFVVDGIDLMMLFDERMDLLTFLRRRQRLLAEQGRVCVPFSDV